MAASKRRKRRAVRGVCAKDGCPELASAPGKSYCEDHDPAPWRDARSRRPRDGAGSGWSEQRRARDVIRRHRGICHVCGEPGADQADHVVPLAQGGADALSNLRPIHSTPCHARKISGESVSGRSR